jgi:predicted nucleic acid-binding protein
VPRIYLDNCALQRPLDDRVQFRVRAEADAITAVLAALEAGGIELLTSAVLRAEISRLQDPIRRDFVRQVLAMASEEAPPVDALRERIYAYHEAGIKPFDAMHPASAVAAGADYFCTSDDRFLRKGRRVNTEGTRVVTPLELALALNL